MKKIIAILLISYSATAGSYFTKTGTITFKGKSKVEKIEAINKSVACKLDATTGAVDFIVLVKSFVFDSQLMQEHFNENYLESDKFPKASFKGKITNLAEINFAKDGVYKANVQGVFAIHGVSQTINGTGNITVKGGKVSITSNIGVLCSTYKIDIPSAVKDKVSNEVNISIACNLEALK
jgi:YceI-like domain